MEGGEGGEGKGGGGVTRRGRGLVWKRRVGHREAGFGGMGGRREEALARALMEAAEAGEVEGVKAVLGEVPRMDVNAKDEQGQTPLSLASRKGHAGVVGVLLAAPGIDVNREEFEGTPLFVASRKGWSEVVRLLLAVPGIDVNRVDK